MKDLHDREADAVHDGHATERERLTELLHGAGPRCVTSRVRSIWHFMAELALIAAAAVGGALIGAHYHFWFGDCPAPIEWSGQNVSAASQLVAVVTRSEPDDRAALARPAR